MLDPLLSGHSGPASSPREAATPSAQGGEFSGVYAAQAERPVPAAAEPDAGEEGEEIEPEEPSEPLEPEKAVADAPRSGLRQRPESTSHVAVGTPKPASAPTGGGAAIDPAGEVAKGASAEPDGLAPETATPVGSVAERGQALAATAPTGTGPNHGAERRIATRVRGAMREAERSGPTAMVEVPMRPPANAPTAVGLDRSLPSDLSAGPSFDTAASGDEAVFALADRPAQSMAEPRLVAATARPLAQQLAQQAAAVVTAVGEGRIDVSLDPDELGRVALQMRSDGDRLCLIIAADRLDTTELIRRHLQELSQEFRALGYRSVDISFGARGDGARQEGAPPAAPTSGDDDVAPAAAATLQGPIYLAAPLSGPGLDLRL